MKDIFSTDGTFIAINSKIIKATSTISMSTYSGNRLETDK